MNIVFITNPNGDETALYARAAVAAGHTVALVLLPLSPAPLLNRYVNGQVAPTARRRFARIQGALGRLLRSSLAARRWTKARLLSDCRRSGIPVRYVWSLRSATTRRILADTAPDILVTAALSHRVPRSLLQLPQRGALNVHGGLLPDYGGPCSAFWAVYDRAQYAGVTFHTLTSRLDSGWIILRRRARVREGETPERLAHRLIEAAAHSFPEACRRLVENRFEYAEETRSRLRPRPTPEQIADLYLRLSSLPRNR
ncbi:MAG: hypothetical protein HYY13_12355 [Nitrospirae bacterium]|nr:hypothetical protein [Nitrospirota bacterium]